jgi:hypothetical protein
LAAIRHFMGCLNYTDGIDPVLLKPFHSLVDQGQTRDGKQNPLALFQCHPDYGSSNDRLACTSRGLHNRSFFSRQKTVPKFVD